MSSTWRKYSNNLAFVGAAPCKDCTERTVGCHSTCEGYMEYKIKHSKAKDLLDESRRVDRIHQEYVFKQRTKELRARGWS